MPTLTARRTPDATRQTLLMAAFDEFYHNGFQGGSLNRIVESAGATKGALFHHFAGKQQLGYAVLDEVIEPILVQRWLEPLGRSTDPVTVLQRAFRRYVKEDVESGNWLQGCPLNNLAQEMSPLDDGFRSRIDRLYTTWRKWIASAFARGIKAGTVRRSVDPHSVSAMLVASQMGIWGTGKSSRSKAVMTQLTEGVCDYLESLRA